MKNVILFSAFALLAIGQAAAQEYEYVPFVREGVKWVYYIINYHYDPYNNPQQGNNVVYRTLELKGDTVINGKTYKAMHKYSGDGINWDNDTIPVYLREEDKVVYGIIPNGISYSDCPVYNTFATTTYYDGDVLVVDHANYYNGQEFVLYDFNNPIAYWNELIAASGDQYSSCQLYYTDTVSIGQHWAKRYVGKIHSEFEQIESIGLIASNTTPLCLFMPLTTGTQDCHYGLKKVIEDGEVVYPKNYVEDTYLPVIREGVTWVNEKVIVNNGDTTSYYYTYRFDGLAPFKNGYNQAFMALYYTDNSIENDSLIAGLREDEAFVMCHNNQALNRVIEQDRNMINFYTYQYSEGTQALYGLYTFYSNDFYAVDFFMQSQREQFLSQENFVNVDPIEIDGVKCSRCAYINEQGDTLAYVVEGIGFDSRDMGDLLTPFTRKPDPNADYQEYWGLSHVIKGDKIIYKGMRYRKGAHDGIDEVVADGTARLTDNNYYNLMGQPVGKDLPTTPGIYIHQGRKIVVR